MLSTKDAFLAAAVLLCGCAAQSDSRPAPNPTNDNSGKITATAEFWSDKNAAARKIESLDGLSERIIVDPGERIHLRLVLADLEPSMTVDVEAPHGGALGEDGGPFVWTPRSSSEPLELSFLVGPWRGRYPITLTQGERVEVVDLYAGQEKPVGEPGPVRTFAQGGER